MKFKEYVEGINKMLEEHPEYGEMEMEQTERWAGDGAWPFLHREGCRD